MWVGSEDRAILIDVTRDFASQARATERVDLVLLTHSHRDAAGGVAQLDRWLGEGRTVPIISSQQTVRTLRNRYRSLRHLELRGVSSGTSTTWRGCRITSLAVPHARDCTTFAWRVELDGSSIVYASDVSALTSELASQCAGCDLLVLDGAMWHRRIFTHLEITSTVPIVAQWPVRRVLFTQLGRSTPPHAVLDRWLSAYDPRFGAAFDGLEICMYTRASRSTPAA